MAPALASPAIFRSTGVCLAGIAISHTFPIPAKCKTFATRIIRIVKIQPSGNPSRAGRWKLQTVLHASVEVYRVVRVNLGKTPYLKLIFIANKLIFMKWKFSWRFNYSDIQFCDVMISTQTVTIDFLNF